MHVLSCCEVLHGFGIQHSIFWMPNDEQELCFWRSSHWVWEGQAAWPDRLIFPLSCTARNSVLARLTLGGSEVRGTFDEISSFHIWCLMMFPKVWDLLCTCWLFFVTHQMSKVNFNQCFELSGTSSEGPFWKWTTCTGRFSCHFRTLCLRCGVFTSQNIFGSMFPTKCSASGTVCAWIPLWTACS